MLEFVAIKFIKLTDLDIRFNHLLSQNRCQRHTDGELRRLCNNVFVLANFPTFHCLTGNRF